MIILIICFHLIFILLHYVLVKLILLHLTFLNSMLIQLIIIVFIILRIIIIAINLLFVIILLMIIQTNSHLEQDLQNLKIFPLMVIIYLKLNLSFFQQNLIIIITFIILMVIEYFIKKFQSFIKYFRHINYLVIYFLIHQYMLLINRPLCFFSLLHFLINLNINLHC